MNSEIELQTKSSNPIARFFRYMGFFTLSPRLNRQKYLILCCLYLLLGFLIVALYIALPICFHEDSVVFMPVKTVLIVLMAALAVSNYFLCIRRLHDINISGLWLLLAFIPVLNIFFVLFLFFKKGTIGDNRYGPDPLASKRHLGIVKQV